MRRFLLKTVSVILVLVIGFYCVPALGIYIGTEAHAAALENQAADPKIGETETATGNDSVHDYLTDHSLMSYRYRATDDYYYVCVEDAWQSVFGFNQAYDLVAPFVMMEYDYVRVHFTYEGQDWLIQLWKGQYGMIFYGAEVGVYSKTASDEADTITTTYNRVKGSDRPYIQMTLYHDATLTGNYEREFTTPYEQTWWSTGFKPGHLTVEEPATELRQTSRITFKDATMAKLFAEGLKECGFSEGSGTALDSFSRSGNDIYYTWQNISEAENTMPIKTAGAALLLFNVAAIFGAIVLGAGMMIAFGLLMFII